MKLTKREEELLDDVRHRQKAGENVDFVGPERRIADRLVKKGALTIDGGGWYGVRERKKRKRNAMEELNRIVREEAVLLEKRNKRVRELKETHRGHTLEPYRSSGQLMGYNCSCGVRINFHTLKEEKGRYA